ncbi:hypothetical protein Gocc_2859 [Gaiella occulta]|uniref:Uncharacterized protein n=1 Tax=Gaiella occulta TaxID=1002870 RepID=A0A7M2YTT8_9ACTN|nr:hypothetical protein [Gaiella occulta]RDI73503.1 hypothetical protein Gocc_2859 [Gaiella occulta]
MTTVHRNRHDLAARPIRGAITARGKKLSIGDTVGAARRLFANESVRVVPVRDGGRGGAAALDAEGSTWLVVPDDDGTTNVGLVCLRSDRIRLCPDAECHTGPTSSS